MKILITKNMFKIKEIPYKSIRKIAVKLEAKHRGLSENEISVSYSENQCKFDWSKTEQGYIFWQHIYRKEYPLAKKIFNWDNYKKK